jgi:ABC-2 type transport system permease protein
VIRRELDLGIRTALARSYPRIIAANREPSWIVFEVLMPLFSMSALVLVYKALHAPPQYTGFVIVGAAMTAFWTNVVWSMAMQLNWDKGGGNLELWMMAPANTVWVIVGMALGSIVTVTTRAVAVIALGIFIFRVQFPLSGIGPALLAAAVGIFGMYAFGALMASVFLAYGRAAFRFEQLATDPVFMITGTYFPIRAIGAVGATVVALVPLTLTLDAVRQALFPETQVALLPYWTEVGILLVLGIVLAVGAERALAFMEKLGKTRGSMTLKWQ